MKVKALRDLSSEELRLRLQDSRRELFNLRQQWYTGRLEDANRMRSVRKDIARLLTLLRERELSAALKQEGGAA